MAQVSSTFEWLLQWAPTFLTATVLAAAGAYILRKKSRCRSGTGCCRAANAQDVLDEERHEDIVNNINPPEEGLSRFTLEELKDCNGEGGRRLLVGIQGLVYDVGAHKAGRQFYGPGGSYRMFAGKDATTALAKMALEETLLNSAPSTWSCFSDEEKRCIHQWARRFCSKYPLAGVIDFSPAENVAAASWRSEVAKL